MDWELVKMIGSDLAILIGAAIPAIVWLARIVEGQRCQLRADMLNIYYKYKDTKKIRQYEAEHFDKCYHAYKALKGNSFIDEIYKKAHTWEVIT
jgi:hypothetical protein